MMTTGNREDYLINILRLTEGEGLAKTTELASFMNVSPASVSEMIKVLAGEGLVIYEKYKGVQLTPVGLDYARQLRKKHHVLERFLMDYLNIDHDNAHDEACRLEHALSDNSAIKMCHMMGTPVDSDCQSCKSPCKAISEGEIEVCPLNQLSRGDKGVISYVKSDDSSVVKRLVSMGFVPGRMITIDAILSDGGPRIILMGDATIALDYSMASNIFVDINIE